METNRENKIESSDKHKLEMEQEHDAKVKSFWQNARLYVLLVISLFVMISGVFSVLNAGFIIPSREQALDNLREDLNNRMDRHKAQLLEDMHHIEDDVIEKIEEVASHLREIDDLKYALKKDFLILREQVKALDAK